MSGPHGQEIVPAYYPILQIVLRKRVNEEKNAHDTSDTNNSQPEKINSCTLMQNPDLLVCRPDASPGLPRSQLNVLLIIGKQRNLSYVPAFLW